MAHAGGRPTKYSTQLVKRICAEISNGKSLRRICEAKDVPAIETIRVWLLDKPGFSAQYDKARQEQADFYADRITEIADDTLASKHEPAAAKVAIDALKWTASKLKPKKYGDKLDVVSDGERLGVAFVNDVPRPKDN